MVCFHIEDAFEQRIDYMANTSSCPLIHKTQVDSFIANEIRLQVNGDQQRSIFSASKSLGVVLFKYNKIGDNPLHIIPIDYLNNLEITLGPNDTHYFIPYDIKNTSYQIIRSINQENFYLHNYAIDVSDNCTLNQYLHTYTPVGKHPYAACEKDNEVLIRHITTNFTFSDELHINAVYLIYALNHRYRFLHNSTVFKDILDCCQIYTPNNDGACHGFNLILNYLVNNHVFELNASNPLILEKQKEERLVCDMYYIALEILDTTLEDNLDIAYYNSYYYCSYSFLNDIWKIFWKWKKGYLV